MSANTNKPSTIKHLVIASGGPAGCTMYGALRLLNQEGIWNMKDIKSIYGSSVGSFISILISLNYDWKTMDTFLLKRPWSKIYMSPNAPMPGTTSSGVAASIAEATSKAASYAFDAKNKLDTISKLYNHNGIYGLKEFTESLRPALEGKDFNVNVTMKEFFDKTGIELHFIVTELNNFISIDISCKTHPNQSMIEACYMSCCYPFIFTPIFRDGCVYLDGGIINDYPVHNCIRGQKCDISEILGVKMEWERIPATMNETTSFTNFMYGFFNQISANFFENRQVHAIPNEVICFSKIQELQDWINVVKDENCRRELVLRGETFAKLFLSYRRNNAILTERQNIVVDQDKNTADSSHDDASNNIDIVQTEIIEIDKLHDIGTLAVDETTAVPEIAVPETVAPETVPQETVVHETTSQYHNNTEKYFRT
jgi:predicted acylesterase/phospholipase RssA